VAAPLYSTAALFAEIIISAIVLYIFYSSFKQNRLPYRLVVFALIYETFFNVGYMVYKTLNHSVPQSAYSRLYLVLGMCHGILSLVMFIVLIIFLMIAWKNYRKKINYFKKHTALTIIFLILWLISVMSGILLYYVAYS